MTETDFRKLVDEAVSTRFRQVAISGGEPFIHPDILSMIEYSTLRIDTIVLTNATMLENPRLSGLSRLNRRNLTVQVSLDSANPERHDSRRGSGSWEKTVRSIRLLLGLDYKVTVRATVTDQTDSEIIDLYLFLEELGIPRNRCHTMPVARGGRCTEGIEYTFGDLVPEPTVARDGLYWHPLKVDRSLHVYPEISPLQTGLLRMAEMVKEVNPPCSSMGYR